MNSEALFSMALGLQAPWQVEEIAFSDDAMKPKGLHIRIGFSRGSRFPDAQGVACAVHDTVTRSWQHLNFFEHACILHCQVPRIKTSAGGIENVEVPWARPGSGFTLLFEAFALALIEREMPVNRVAEILRVNPQRIWTVFNHWVGNALLSDDPSGIEKALVADQKHLVTAETPGTRADLVQKPSSEDDFWNFEFTMLQIVPNTSHNKPHAYFNIVLAFFYCGKTAIVMPITKTRFYNFAVI